MDGAATSTITLSQDFLLELSIPLLQFNLAIVTFKL